jgi:hypothetical protein
VALRWQTGPLKRVGRTRYVHLARGLNDPEPGARSKTEDPLAQRARLKKASTKAWERKLKELLGDGRPRTFQEIAVTLLDRTADAIVDLPPDQALWALVDIGVLEHTLDAPILFRTKGSTQEPGEKKAQAARPPAEKTKAYAKGLVESLGKEKAREFALQQAERLKTPFWIDVYAGIP